MITYSLLASNDLSNSVLVQVMFMYGSGLPVQDEHVLHYNCWRSNKLRSDRRTSWSYFQAYDYYHRPTSVWCHECHASNIASGSQDF